MLIKFMNKHKFLCALVLMSCVLVSATFAEVNTETMDSKINNVVDFFNGGWVKGICCILLIGECLGLLFAGGQNPQIFKKFLPFIIGTVLFMCAGKIVTIIWGTSDSTFSADLTSMIEKVEELPYSNITELA